MATLTVRRATFAWEQGPRGTKTQKPMFLIMDGGWNSRCLQAHGDNRAFGRCALTHV